MIGIMLHAHTWSNMVKGDYFVDCVTGQSHHEILS